MEGAGDDQPMADTDSADPAALMRRFSALLQQQRRGGTGGSLPPALHAVERAFEQAEAEAHAGARCGLPLPWGGERERVDLVGGLTREVETPSPFKQPT